MTWTILNAATDDTMRIRCSRREVEDLIALMNILDATGLYQLA